LVDEGNAPFAIAGQVGRRTTRDFMIVVDSRGDGDPLTISTNPTDQN
jgi:hypothetical protein